MNKEHSTFSHRVSSLLKCAVCYKIIPLNTLVEKVDFSHIDPTIADTKYFVTCPSCNIRFGVGLGPIDRIVEKEQEKLGINNIPLAPASTKTAVPKLTGEKLKGDHYYRIEVPNPISDELAPYIAECGDIIEALNMTFAEGEAFKAIWRLAAGRLGKGKQGNTPQYDADKVKYYGERIALHTRKMALETHSTTKVEPDIKVNFTCEELERCIKESKS